MLSTLPKLADKAFVVGFFLPTLLFGLAVLALLSDLQPLGELLSALIDAKVEKILYFALAVWTIAVFISLVNTLQYRILEGYIWPLANCSWLKAREQTRFDTLNKRVGELNAMRGEAGNRLDSSVKLELQRKWIQLRARFPEEEQLFLPTEFGNAIRAFEQYPNKVYNADGVTLWPHLSSVIGKDMQARLADARAQVDFLVNICFFALVTGLIATLRIGWKIGQALFGQLNIEKGFFPSSRSLWLLATVVAAPMIARIAYKLATLQAYAWGTWVKAAFDCYLPDLAKQLGFKLPKGSKERREFWGGVSYRVAYHYPFETRKWAESDEAATVAPAAATTDETKRAKGNEGKEGKQGNEGDEGEEDAKSSDSENGRTDEGK